MVLRTYLGKLISNLDKSGQVVDERVHNEEEGDDVDGAIGQELFEVPAQHRSRPDLGGIKYLNQEIMIQWAKCRNTTFYMK